MKKKQICAITGRLVWDNVGILREITGGEIKEEFSIISRLDQRKASHFLDDLYGGVFPYKRPNDSQKQVCIKNIWSRNLSEKKRDVMWLKKKKKKKKESLVNPFCIYLYIFFVSILSCIMQRDMICKVTDLARLFSHLYLLSMHGYYYVT